MARGWADHTLGIDFSKMIGPVATYAMESRKQVRVDARRGVLRLVCEALLPNHKALFFSAARQLLLETALSLKRKELWAHLEVAVKKDSK